MTNHHDSLPDRRVNIRLRLLGRIAIPRFVRRHELERLFTATARSFGAEAPSPRRDSLEARLREYALFTRERASEALARGETGKAVRTALYGEGRMLGERYRRQLCVRTAAEVRSAARLIYRCIGVDFHCDESGRVVVSRCAFSEYYNPEICDLISSLDAGLLAGLSAGNELRFRERITQGYGACTGRLIGRYT